MTSNRWCLPGFYHLILLLLKGHQWTQFNASWTKWVQTIEMTTVYSWFPEFPGDWPYNHKIINGLQFLGGIYTGEPVLFLLSIFVLKIGRTTFNLPITCIVKISLTFQLWPYNLNTNWFIYFLQGVSCLISAQLEIWHHLIYQPTKTAYQQ